jgi:uncharacterized protein YxeA
VYNISIYDLAADKFYEYIFQKECKKTAYLMIEMENKGIIIDE